MNAQHLELKISVNNRVVVVTSHELTGLQIKQAAIAADVPIALDFVLSEELGDKRTRVVGDNEEVPLHEDSKFVAVAPDDNS
jgi:Multiubiquitin